MNKNLFIYSFKYLAVLLALVTFSGCTRDEFTEQDAFDLNEAQLNAQDAREQAALAAQDKRVMDMAMFRRSMDSLTRLNSGGKVFYTVNVVPGGSSAFSQGGRFEEVEGLDGATVTVSQLGGAIVEQKVTVAGLASFEMYSGEVTVNVEAPNHTDLNYTANLTPDGGVPNGSLIYVGNVVPVFDDPNNPGAGSEENLATVKGFAFAELDITSGNNQEEAVPDGTKVRAFIDINADFMTRYIKQANDEGLNIGGNVTKSGFIQRFAYEEAASTTGTTVTSPLNNDTAPEGGEYSISIGATASGLPITMKFDDFAADRTYYFTDSDGDNTGFFGAAGQKRFIYTQNTQGDLNQKAGGTNGAGGQAPTVIGRTGVRDLALGNVVPVFSFVTTEATATATLKGGDAVASVSITDGGYYYVAPTVTFDAAPTGGTTATGTAVLGDLPAFVIGEDAELTEARNNNLKQVVSVTVTSAGSGYTSTPSVTFTRFSYTGRLAGGLPVPNGEGNIVAPTTGLSYVQIIDGGFGMTSAPGPVAPGTVFSTQFQYTGFAPTAVFSPDVTITGNTAATAIVAVDQNIGVATEVQMVTPGTGYNQATVLVDFTYGTGGNISTAGQPDQEADGVAIFESNGAGGIRFNDNTAGGTLITTVNSATAVEYALEEGRRYSFVPRVTVVGLPAGATSPTFVTTVDGDPASATFGQILSIGLNGAGANITAALQDIEIGSLSILVTPFDAGIEARAFTSSGGIDNYVLVNYGQPTSGIYRSSVNDSGAPFEYISVNAAGEYRRYVDGAQTGGVLATRPAVPTEAQFNNSSNFQVAFLSPTGGAAASGYPIFDAQGTSLVGIVIKSAGVNYATGTTLGVDNLSFWVIPNGVTLAEYAQWGTNEIPDANANATATRTTTNLTITFNTPGAGYAVRPEFIISGGNKSVEDLAAINSSINVAVRGKLNFNGAGAITNTSVVYNGVLPFTAAGIASEPIAITVSTQRLVGIFNREVDWVNNVGPFDGGILIDSPNGTDLDAPEDWIYDTDLDITTSEGPLAMFNLLENLEFTADDRIGTATLAFPNGTPQANFKYITPPTYVVEFLGFDTGGNGVAVLDAASADIVALDSNDDGGLPAGLGLSSYFTPTNDPNTTGLAVAGSTTGARSGERFRTIGGRSNFDVFSGLTYIRDVNYGTGIELE